MSPGGLVEQQLTPLVQAAVGPDILLRFMTVYGIRCYQVSSKPLNLLLSSLVLSPLGLCCLRRCFSLPSVWPRHQPGAQMRMHFDSCDRPV
eukprot:SAG22_NODE_14525_length_372_cov_0.985348_2_plen_90_part_01